MQEIFLCVPIRRAIPFLDRTETCSTARLTQTGVLCATIVAAFEMEIFWTSLEQICWN
jgi:hypothetical protein